MTRPDHHTEALAMLEKAAYQAELYTHLNTLLGSICAALDMDNADLVIGAVRERAKRDARASMAKLARQAIREERDHAAESH